MNTDAPLPCDSAQHCVQLLSDHLTPEVAQQFICRLEARYGLASASLNPFGFDGVVRGDKPFICVPLEYLQISKCDANKPNRLKRFAKRIQYLLAGFPGIPSLELSAIVTGLPSSLVAHADIQNELPSKQRDMAVAGLKLLRAEWEMAAAEGDSDLLFFA